MNFVLNIIVFATLLPTLASASQNPMEKAAPKPQSFLNARKLNTETENKQPTESNSEWNPQLRWGAGYSFVDTLSHYGLIRAFTVVVEIDDAHALQINIGTAGPNEIYNQFALGVIYRRMIIGTRMVGIHVGGMTTLGVGKDGAAAFEIGPCIGPHVAVFGLQKLQLAFDAGPTFTAAHDVQVKPIGNTLISGSLNYFF